MSNLFLDSGATFSEDRMYRHALWRIWDTALPLLMMLMLNPSVAAQEASDPTVTRQIKRAVQLGCGGLLVGNIFDFCATDPRDMKKAELPCSGWNDNHLLTMARRTQDSGGVIVCAWGINGGARGVQVREMLANFPLHYLRLTQDGSPEHPLYIPYLCKPKRWKA